MRRPGPELSCWATGKERKGKERKGKERKGKERKGKERKGRYTRQSAFKVKCLVTRDFCLF
jgi:hypothetical protein